MLKKFLLSLLFLIIISFTNDATALVYFFSSDDVSFEMVGPSEAPLCYRFTTPTLEDQLQRLRKKYGDVYYLINGEKNNRYLKVFITKGNQKIELFYFEDPDTCNKKQLQRRQYIKDNSIYALRDDIFMCKTLESLDMVAVLRIMYASAITEKEKEDILQKSKYFFGEEGLCGLPLPNTLCKVVTDYGGRAEIQLLNGRYNGTYFVSKLSLIESINKTKEDVNLSGTTPQTQIDFTKLIEEFAFLYKQNKDMNEIAKTRIRLNRRVALSKIQPTFTKWVGTIRTISTHTNGDAWVSVKLINSDITIDNIGYYIKHGTVIWGSLSNIEENAKVCISGKFIIDNEVDYFYEGSVTENGSMTAPEFRVEYTDIIICE